LTRAITYTCAANDLSNAGWTYDAAGNLTADGSATYAFDALSRLTGTTSGNDHRN
jgi:YD repeat-containing protein